MGLRGSSVSVAAALLALVACSSGGTDETPSPVVPAPTVLGTETLRAEPALAGRLLFSRFDESTHTFLSTHVALTDGSRETEIEMPGPEGGGRWSRSGKEIAVMTERDDGRIGTAIITPTGEVVRVLEIEDETLNLVCTVWSRDDSRLACEGWDDGDPARSGIYTVRASDGGDLVRLTEPPAGQVDLPGDYAVDGFEILFKRSAGEDPGPLMRVAADGSDEASYLTDALVDDPGRYSPDSRTILTTADGELVFLTASGIESDRVALPGLFVFGAVWSPDGSHIAFSGGRSGPFADIYTSRPDGRGLQQVTSTDANEIVVEWGADSR